MRNNTEYIARYLQNDLSDEEKNTFEKELNINKELQQEFYIQQQIMKAAETAGLKNEFTRAIRKKMINQRLVQWGIVGAILVAAFAFYAIKTGLFSKEQEKKNSVAEYFQIKNEKDTIIETRDGVVFAIPAYAFKSNNDNIRLEIKTALSPYDIMRQGLSTMSNGSMLQTAGMFYINGYDGDQPVSLQKNISVSVPAKEIDTAMKLFKGVEDENGNVNWVDPKPIGNGLRSYDITTLDFYPPAYIPTLKELGKDHTNKRYTDSLYYSFSSYNFGPAITDIVTLSADIEIYSESGPATPDTAIKDTAKIPVRDSDMSDTTGSIKKDSGNSYYHFELDPSRIHAIWGERFNNTILATKEFEERLRYMHGLCTPVYFDTYLNNLNKPLYEIDQLCANMSSGDVRQKFLEFAARKDGGVRIKGGMQEELSDYFQKKYKAYQLAVEETMEKYQAELKKLDQIADDKKREQTTRDFVRTDKNFQEELCANLTDAYRQIGVKRSCSDTAVPPPARSYIVEINGTGWYNLDKYVFDATITRQSMNYTDPVTGKTATLTYKDVSISIEDLASYDKVFVYLIPDSLSSFQRIVQEGTIFKESLNALFRYDAVAIGFKGTQKFFYRQTNLQPGDHSFNLSMAKDEELKQTMKNYSIQRSMDLNTEFEFRIFEQMEATRQVLVRKDIEFREQIANAIWLCDEGSMNSPALPPESRPYLK